MKWHNIKITIGKEVRTIFRDKRSMRTLIILPLIIPFYIFLMGFMEDMMLDDEFDVGVNYDVSITEKAIAYEAGDFSLVKYENEDALKTAFENGEIKAYILKDKNKYTIYYDGGATAGSMLSQYIYVYLESYNRYLGENYLVSQDIDTDLVFKNIEIDMKSIDESNKDAMLVMLLSICISYILLIVAQSAATVAADATAGEKERGTLETLLTFPIKSSEIITGKYLAITIFGLFFGLVSIILTVPSLMIASKMFEIFEEIQFNFTAISLILALLIIILDSFLCAGVCMALAGNSKSYKEAQASLQFVTVFSMLPMFLEILDMNSKYFNLIPLANCGIALNNVLIDKIDIVGLLIMLISSIVYVFIIIIVISKQYKSEKTLFS